MRSRMFWISVLIVVFGLWAALGVVFEPLAKSLLGLATWRWQLEPLTPAGAAALAIQGGVMAGWGVTFIALCRAPGLADDAFVAIVRGGAGAWFLVDGLASVAAGAAPNLALNVVFLGLALWATRAAPSGRMRPAVAR